MHSLAINIQTIQFNSNIIHGNEKIKVNVITIPGHERQTIIIDLKNKDKNNNFINFKTNKENIKKLVFIFEKKNFFQLNPMIASRAIDSTNLPYSSNDSKNIELKTFEIYKPIRCQEDLVKLSSRVAGEMTIQCISTVQSPLNNLKSPHNISKIHKGEGYSAINENNNENRLLLLDDEYIN